MRQLIQIHPSERGVTLYNVDELGEYDGALTVALEHDTVTGVVRAIPNPHGCVAGYSFSGDVLMESHEYEGTSAADVFERFESDDSVEGFIYSLNIINGAVTDVFVTDAGAIWAVERDYRADDYATDLAHQREMRAIATAW